MRYELRITEEAIKKAAVLAGAGMTAPRIRALLKVSQPTTSRLLREARKHGFLETRCTLPETEIREIEHLIHADSVLTRQEGWSKRFRQVKIVSGATGRHPDPKEPWSDFDLGVARYILEALLPRATRMGITWGGVLHGVVKAVESQRVDSSAYEGLLVFPVCGDPPQIARRPEWSSSSLAARMQRAVGAQRELPASLVGVAAFIPESFSLEEVATLRRALTFAPGYDTIFSPQGLAAQMDCLLTGIGTNSDRHDPLWGVQMRPRARAARERAAIGNVGGVLLRRSTARDGDLQRLADQNDRWTGIQDKHLERCARRGASGKVPGTIVVATGADKVDVLEEGIRRGFINHAIVDETLAAALSKKSSRTATSS